MRSQDLKQHKFTIDAEPSETVGVSHSTQTADRFTDTLREDWGGQREDRGGERMGGGSTKAHLLW
jgi:hypothetical protein